MDTATLKGLLEKATKGPWKIIDRETLEDGSIYPRHIVGGANELQVCMMETTAIAAMAQKTDSHWDAFNNYCKNNSEFICALRNNAEELIARAERVARLEAALSGLLEVCHCTNDCSPDDMTCATNVARQALGGAK